MSAEIRCFKEENLEARLSAVDLPFFLFLFFFLQVILNQTRTKTKV